MFPYPFIPPELIGEIMDPPPVERRERFYCGGPEEVRISFSSYLSGARVLRYKGPHVVTITAERVLHSFYLVEEKMRQEAFYLDCNAVINFERELDLWADPMECRGQGTLAIIGPLRCRS